MTSQPARCTARFTAAASAGALIVTSLALAGAPPSVASDRSAAAAAAVSDWGAARELSGTSVLSSPDVTAGPSGGLHVVWGAGAGDIRSRRRPPAAAWEAVQSIGTGGSPQIASDAHGNVTAVWFRKRAGKIPEIVAARRPVNGSWGAPVIISRTADDTGDETSPREVDLAVGPGGAVVAAWSWGSDEGGPARRVQAAYRSATGAWQGPTDITTPSTCSGQAATAVGPAGNAMVVCLGNGGVISVVRHVGSDWLAPVAISGTNNARPDVAVGPSGGTVAVWEHHTFPSDDPPVEESFTITAKRFVNGTWTGPQTLSAADGMSFRPLVAVDGTQKTTAVWRADDGGLNAARRPGASSALFGAWRSIAPAGDTIGAIELASNSAGDVVVGWIRVGVHNTLEAVTRPHGHAWTSPVPLSGPLDVAGDEATAGVTVDPCGRGVVVWQDDRVRVRRMTACTS